MTKNRLSDRSWHSDDLPAVGETFFDMADTLAARSLSRDVAVTSIVRTDGHGGLIETRYHPAEEVLSPLGVLKIIRDLKTYRGDWRDISRSNVQTIAQLGGFAAYGIYGLLPPRGLSEEAMDGLRASFWEVHKKMNHAFYGAARSLPKDRAVLSLLIELGHKF